MSYDILASGSRHVEDVRNFNKKLTEKALALRCSAYIAHQKAKLLTLTIFDINKSKRILKSEIEDRRIMEKNLRDKTKQLEDKNKELTKALNEVKTLSGLIPICSSCKKIRDDKGYWNQVEVYISKHTEANFTHGICPDCTKTFLSQLK